MSRQPKFSEFISPTEIRELSQKSTPKALLALATSWGLILGAFTLAIVLPNPLTIALSVLILASRQLALGILTHECAHFVLFPNKTANNFVGHWFCGSPIDLSLHDYREYHLQHHRHAGTAKDPDRPFVAKYPIEPSSLKRKFLRDFTGRTGIRDTIANLRRFRLAKNYPWVIFHFALLACLTAAGAAWAYLLWWIAQIFIYPALTRLRQIGEHGVALDRDSADPRMNTSTTNANVFERLFVAPHNVHFHLEHHQCAGVPAYNLPKLHQLLKQRGYFDGFDCISKSYRDVLRRAVRA